MRCILKEAMPHRLMALVILATASSLSLPASAVAQTNSVSWGAGQPNAPAPGKITGSGTYTTAAGWAPSSVSLTAVPTAGGTPIVVAGAMPAGGTWGAIDIKGVAKGQYTVYATIVFRSGVQRATVVSPTAILNAPYKQDLLSSP